MGSWLGFVWPELSKVRAGPKLTEWVNEGEICSSHQKHPLFFECTRTLSLLGRLVWSSLGEWLAGFRSRAIYYWSFIFKAAVINQIFSKTNKQVSISFFLDWEGHRWVYPHVLSSHPHTINRLQHCTPFS